jgi:hypothetical protein
MGGAVSNAGTAKGAEVSGKGTGSVKTRKSCAKGAGATLGPGVIQGEDEASAAVAEAPTSVATGSDGVKLNFGTPPTPSAPASDGGLPGGGPPSGATGSAPTAGTALTAGRMRGLRRIGGVVGDSSLIYKKYNETSWWDKTNVFRQK